MAITILDVWKAIGTGHMTREYDIRSADTELDIEVLESRIISITVKDYDVKLVIDVAETKLSPEVRRVSVEAKLISTITGKVIETILLKLSAGNQTSIT